MRLGKGGNPDLTGQQETRLSGYLSKVSPGGCLFGKAARQ
jgi:hypothetical protein